MPLPVVPAAAALGVIPTSWANLVRDALIYLDEQAGGIGRRNVLINSHFDVWQRGTSFAVPSTTKTYCSDRWYAYRTATGCTVSRQTGPTGQRYKMRVQRDSGNSSTAVIKVGQAVETATSVQLADRECFIKFSAAAGANFSAASALLRVKVTTGTGTDQDPVAGFTGSSDVLDETVTLTTTLQDFALSFAVADTATQVAVSFEYTPVGTAGANDYFEITAAQLTAGSTSDYERLPVGQTLRECQRYYYQWGPWGASAAIGVELAASTTVAYHMFTLPTPMRAAPTVSVSANNDFTVGVQTTTSVVAYSVVPNTQTHRVVLVFTVASGLTAAAASGISNAADTANAAIYFTAEL